MTQPALFRRGTRGGMPLTQLIALSALLAGVLMFAVTAQAETHVSNAWARETPPGASVGAAYLQLHNMSSETVHLVGVTASVAARSEFHESVMNGDQMSMRHHDRLAIKPDGLFEFAPGGHHVMLMGLKSSLVEGESFLLKLEFEDKPAVEITVDVKPIGYAMETTHDSMNHDHNTQESATSD